jgi:hypothetical protein
MGFAARRGWRSLRRRAVATATVVAVAACAVGVPVPAYLQKHSVERYPCEQHPCGCMDAESCWRDCCCMTHGEKLAWARQAGVRPPAFVVAAAAREIIVAKTSHPAGGGCCSAKATPKSCCSSGGGCCSSKVAATPARKRGMRVVAFHAAMKCRGLTVSVALLPPSLPILNAEFFPPVVERYEVRVDDSHLRECPYLAIPTPPPRCAHA